VIKQTVITYSNFSNKPVVSLTDDTGAIVTPRQDNEREAVEWFMSLSLEAQLAQITHMWEDRQMQNAANYDRMAG